MLRDVMLPQKNASHQKKAPNVNKQQTCSVQETRSRGQQLERCCTVVCLLKNRTTPRRGRKTETSQEPEEGAWNWSGGKRRLSQLKQICQSCKSTDDIELTATRTMLRDVMLPQTNVSHQKTAPKGKQATNVLCSRDEIARTASRKLLHGGMSPEKSCHAQKRAQDRNKPRARGGCMERLQTTVIGTETKL